MIASAGNSIKQALKQGHHDWFCFFSSKIFGRKKTVGPIAKNTIMFLTAALAVNGLVFVPPRPALAWVDEQLSQTGTISSFTTETHGNQIGLPTNQIIDGDYDYLVTKDDTSGDLMLVRKDLTTLDAPTVINADVLASGDWTLNGVVGDTVNNRAYLLTSIYNGIDDTTTSIYVLNLVTGNLVGDPVEFSGATDLGDEWNYVQFGTVDATGDYAYFFSVEPPRVIKIDLDNFDLAHTITTDLSDGTNIAEVNSLAMSPTGNYLYAGAGVNAKIVKIDPSDLSVEGQASLTVTGVSNFAPAIVIDSAGTYGYVDVHVAAGPMPHQFLFKVLLSDLTNEYIDLQTFDSNNRMFIDSAGEYLYVNAVDQNSNTDGLVVVKLSDFSRLDVVTAAESVYWSGYSNATLDPATGKIYIVENGSSPIVIDVLEWAAIGGGDPTPTTQNVIRLGRIQKDTDTTAELSFVLPSVSSTTLTVTFPAGFTLGDVAGVTGACADGGTVDNIQKVGLVITADKHACGVGAVTLSDIPLHTPGTAGAYTISWVNDNPGNTVVYIVPIDQIQVTADITSALTFDVDTLDADACTSAKPDGGYSVGLGTLTPGTAKTADKHICMLLDSNASDGVVVQVKSLNEGLLSASVAHTILGTYNAGATTDLSGAVEAYGICVLDTTKAPGSAGADPQQILPYNGSCAIDSATNAVGGVDNADFQTMVNTSGAPLDGDGYNTVDALVSAKALSTTPAAVDYTDTLTFRATGTF
ncbi:MAG: hypothetical protein PHT12_04385 [Patescibacteria group bacterium]|nr:hypothetical protein [Patescibacteria group bacterium]